MQSDQLKIGVAITGSFCTFDKIKGVVQGLVDSGMKVIPIFSFNARQLDNRFGKADDFVREINSIAGVEEDGAVYTIQDAEPIGPQGYLDVLVIAPCTGNTLAKLCTGITDTPVLMAAKAHLRNEKPLVIAISTNDALSMNFKNIGMLMNMKNIYFVPFGQDNCLKKHSSMISHMELIKDTIHEALEGRQIQPVIR